MPTKIISSKKYIELNANDGSSVVNINNFAYKLPQVVNQLIKLIGNDIVLKGCIVSTKIVNTSIVATISPGFLIQDSILVEIQEPIEIVLPDITILSPTNLIVVYTDFQYLQIASQQPFRVGIEYLSTTGVPNCDWSHDRNRIVLNTFTLNTDKTEILEYTEQFVEIYTKAYYKYGRCADNITPFDYINYIINSYNANPLPVVPTNVSIPGSLEVIHNCHVHNEAQFDRGAVFGQHVDVNGIFKTKGSRTLIESDGIDFKPSMLKINNYETNDDTGVTNDDGTPGLSGLRIGRGSSLPAALFVFDEVDDVFKIGFEGLGLTPIGSGGNSSEYVVKHTHPIQDITEFSTNVESIFNFLFSIKTTDDLNQGHTHQYFSDANLHGELSKMLRNTVGLSWDYSSTAEGFFITPTLNLIQGTNISFEFEGNDIIINADMPDKPLTDITHGNLSGGSLHAVVTTEKPGFLSTVDYSKLLELWNKYESGYFTNEYEVVTTLPATSITTDPDHIFVSNSQVSIWDSKQTSLGFVPENITKKGAIDGYCPLGGDIKIPLMYFPDSIINNVGGGGTVSATSEYLYTKKLNILTAAPDSMEVMFLEGNSIEAQLLQSTAPVGGYASINIGAGKYTAEPSPSSEPGTYPPVVNRKSIVYISGAVKVHPDGTVSAYNADLAENYTSRDSNIPIGTVMCVSSSSLFDVEICQNEVSFCLGVISENPCFLMNDKFDEVDYLNKPNLCKVGLIGKLPVRIIGAIKKGEPIVSAGNGHARAALYSDELVCKIGFANETCNRVDERLIECIIK